MSKPTYIRDANGDLVDASTVAVPANRNFRSAWKRNGAVIEVDMALARAEFRQRAKDAIEARMKGDTGTAVIDAFLMDDAAAKAQLKTLRQQMKQVDTLPAIDNAATPEALVALWNVHVDKLGPNPYT